MKIAQLFDVTGHVALVTGAASGLGYAYADVMSDNGAIVVLVDRDAGGLADAAARLSADGRVIETAVADITDHAALRDAIDRTVAKHGRLDAVFANAGISAGPGFSETPAGEIANIDPAAWQRVLDINLTGTLITVQAAAAHMKRQGSGRIIITASASGLRGQPNGGYAYVATKAAVINLTRQAALELAPYNVMVNAIAPGRFITNIGGPKRDPTFRERVAQTLPIKRYATAGEIQGLALLLASPASSYITGSVISIDGGSTAQ
jgi:NAD(P)-dependent dehydrogenase (short-subunit alcohol dehydrogenase family)